MTSPSSRASLTSMPLELVTQIVRYLPRRDLKSARLVNKETSCLATERFFHTITISHNETSMTQLKNIAASPKWSRQVRSLCWHFDFIDFIAWEDGHTIFSKASKYLPSLPNITDVAFFRLAPLYHVHCLHRSAAQSKNETRLWDGLRLALLNAKRLSTENITSQLTFSHHGSLSALRMGPTPAGFLRKFDSGVDTDEDVSRAGKRIDRVFDADGEMIDCIFATQGFNLRSTTISSVSIGYHQILRLLADSPSLSRLHLHSVRLRRAPTVVTDPLAQVFIGLRNRKLRIDQDPLAVDLIDVMQEGYGGTFSASDKEITEWVRGCNARFLDYVRLAFEEEEEEEEVKW